MKRAKRGRTVPTYDQIMIAARELFSRYGFRDTTVRMIAQKAKVNGASINYYFTSKEALYEAIFEQEFQKSARPLEDLIGTVHDAASWKAALEKWFDFMLELFLLDTPGRALFRRLVAQERCMAMPDETPERFQAVFVTFLGTCTCFMHRDPPWDDIEVCRTVDRETWVRMLRDEIVATLMARHAYVTNRIPPGA